MAGTHPTAVCSSILQFLFVSSYSLQLYLCSFASKVTYIMIQEASNWQPFYIHDFIGSEFCPSLIDNISLRIPCHNIRNFTLFSIAGRNCPSTRHATAANLVRSNIYIYSVKLLQFWNRFCTSNAFHCGFNYLSNLWQNLSNKSSSLLVFFWCCFCLFSCIILL